MAVAFGTSVASHSSGSFSVSQASFSFSITTTSSHKGILVFVFQGVASADAVTGVTIGGVNMIPVAGGRAADTATEPGSCKAYFLGTGLPSAGSNSVVVTRTNNTTTMWAVAIACTATVDTQIGPSIVLLQEDGTLAVQSVTDGSPGTNSVRFAGVYTGLASPPSVGTGSTSVSTNDAGAYGWAVARETTAGQGARNIGFSSGTSDDRAAVHLSVREVTSIDLKNSCTGTNGSTVTTANTGGPNQFDEVDISGAGAAMTFSNTHSWHGNATSIHAVGGASISYVAWNIATDTVFSRMYFNFPSNPTAAARIICIADQTTFVMCAGVYVNTTGHIVVDDSAFGVLGTSTTVVTGADCRIELDIVGNPGSGTWVCRIYTSIESNTPAETLSGSSANLHGVPTQIQFGATDFGSVGSDFYFADVEVNDTGAVGPVPVTSVTGTGSIAMHKMKLAASGTPHMIGTGSVRMHKMGLSSSGSAALRGTGSIAMHKMALTSTGGLRLTATGSVRMHKMGLAATGGEKLVATGSVSMHKMGLSGSGRAFVGGTGSVGMHKMALALTGVLKTPDIINTFEGITSGTTLSNSNSGGISGRKVDSVTTVTGGTIAADNSKPGLGAIALKVATTTNAGIIVGTWSLAGTLSYTRTKMYFRSDQLITSAATPAFRPIVFRNSSGTHVFSILITANNVSASYGSGFTGVGTIYGSVPNNTYFRVEGFIDTVAGTIHVEVYATQSAAVPVAVGNFSSISFGDVIGRIDVGNGNSATSDGPFWIDQVGFSENGPMSPPSVRMHKMGLSGSGYEKLTATGSVRMHKMGLAATGHAPLYGTGSIRMHKMGLAGSGYEKLTATGSVAMHKMGLAGSGAEHIIGTGSVAMHKMGLSATGQEVIIGSGSVSMHKMGLSGSGVAFIGGTGSVAMHKMGLSSSGSAALQGTGSVAMHKMALSSSGFAFIGGSGSVSMHKMGLSGTASAPLYGTGSVFMHKMALDGSGTVGSIISGDGSVAMHKMGLSGTATAPLYGTGSVSMHKMGLSGFGTEYIIGTGSVSMHKMGLSGSATAPLYGTGSVSMHKMGLFGSGTAVSFVNGTGSVAMHKMGLSAAGTAPLYGAGSVRMHKMGLSGTGHEKLTATGSVSMHKMGLAGSGKEKIIGTGSAAMHKMRLSGSGAVQADTGTGSVRMHKMGLSGSSFEIIRGSGSVRLKKMGLTGTGQEKITGTGSVSMNKMRLHGLQARPRASNLFIFTPV